MGSAGSSLAKKAHQEFFISINFPFSASNSPVTSTLTGNKNTPAIPAPSMKSSFGDIAADNVHAPGFEATGTAYTEQAKKTADYLAKVDTAEGAAKKAAIDTKNEPILAKSKAQETELQRIAKEYGMNVDKSRTDADTIFKRQEQIASRQANMGAAQAGESGLTMSQ